MEAVSLITRHIIAAYKKCLIVYIAFGKKNAPHTRGSLCGGSYRFVATWAHRRTRGDPLPAGSKHQFSPCSPRVRGRSRAYICRSTAWIVFPACAGAIRTYGMEGKSKQIAPKRR
jgi:hypothetical protein